MKGCGIEDWRGSGRDGDTGKRPYESEIEGWVRFGQVR